MKTRVFISRLLLAIFVMVQLTVLHELQHDDSSQHCEVCLLAHDMQSASFELQPVAVINDVAHIPVVKKQFFEYNASAKASTETSHLSIRPPPAV